MIGDIHGWQAVRKQTVFCTAGCTAGVVYFLQLRSHPLGSAADLSALQIWQSQPTDIKILRHTCKRRSVWKLTSASYLDIQFLTNTHLALYYLGSAKPTYRPLQAKCKKYMHLWPHFMFPDLSLEYFLLRRMLLMLWSICLGYILFIVN